MTEDQAKTKWCPFARDAQEGIGTYNRIGGGFIQDRNDKGVFLFKDAEGTIGTRGEFASGVMVTPLGHTAPILPAETCLCIASACMAWRPTVVPQEGSCALMSRS